MLLNQMVNRSIGLYCILVYFNKSIYGFILWAITILWWSWCDDVCEWICRILVQLFGGPRSFCGQLPVTKHEHFLNKAYVVVYDAQIGNDRTFWKLFVCRKFLIEAVMCGFVCKLLEVYSLKWEERRKQKRGREWNIKKNCSKLS